MLNFESFINYKNILFLVFMILIIILTLIIMYRHKKHKKTYGTNILSIKTFHSNMLKHFNKTTKSTFIMMRIIDFDELLSNYSHSFTEVYLNELSLLIKKHLKRQIKIIFLEQLKSFVIFIPDILAEKNLYDLIYKINKDCLKGILINERYLIKNELKSSVLLVNTKVKFEILFQKLVDLSIYQTKEMNNDILLINFEMPFKVDQTIYQTLIEYINFNEIRHVFIKNEDYKYDVEVLINEKKLSEVYQILLKENDMYWFTYHYIKDVLNNFILNKTYKKSELYIPVFKEVLANENLMNKLKKLIINKNLDEKYIYFYDYNKAKNDLYNINQKDKDLRIKN